MRLSLLVGLLALSACGAEPDAPPITPDADDLGVPARLAARLGDADVHVLDQAGDAYALVVLSTPAGDVIVQWADLDSVAVAQVVGPRVEGVATAGAFHPTAPSPRFEMVPSGALVRQQSADDRLLAVVNGAFFETPGEPSTQLAFPVAENGAVVTGGSSPYGPGRPGAEGERWSRPLRALGLADGAVRVVDYDPATGVPLGAPAFAEAVVSYAPDAHPTRVATRFHVLGPVDADSTGASSELVIATGLNTTIDALSALVSRLGVAPVHQVALDGGASVLVWNRRAGTLQRPTAAGGLDPQPLPHYLVLRHR
ncbi:hypothetical protein [Rubrivirga sp.]|uniref:hypothetical protein n=1 Tax=Rubrivirga sp. TaxID=1885344 RepID=UPI003B523310